MPPIFNPLHDVAEPPKEESTSSLINDIQGICPKCKQPFGTGTIGDSSVYYCDSCRVCQPMQR